MTASTLTIMIDKKPLTIGGLKRSLIRRVNYLINSTNKSTAPIIDHHHHPPSPPSSCCPVPANQIEIDFVSLTTASLSFIVRVRTPNNAESSCLMHFTGYGHTSNYTPLSTTACGHGNWTIDIYQRIDHRIVHIRSHRMYLDGVGSLLFSIGDDLVPRLSSQEFLRLPSASRCCGRMATKLLIDDGGQKSEYTI